MRYKYGFIGTGNMGSALARAVVKKCPQNEIALANRSSVKAETLSDEMGGTVLDSESLCESSRFILLCVKPQMLENLMPTLKTALLKNFDDTGIKPVLITPAAGVTMDTVLSLTGITEWPVIRIMPNTPVSIGDGVILATKNTFVADDDFSTFVSDFSAAGIVEILPEELIDAASVISGCGPAYIYMYIDALAKAGQQLGLSREMAENLAKATARGSAALSMASDESLETLRERVCSPGGSTIEGVKSFITSDLDKVVEKALAAAYNRTKELAEGK